MKGKFRVEFEEFRYKAHLYIKGKPRPWMAQGKFILIISENPDKVYCRVAEIGEVETITSPLKHERIILGSRIQGRLKHNDRVSIYEAKPVPADSITLAVPLNSIYGTGRWSTETDETRLFQTLIGPVWDYGSVVVHEIRDEESSTYTELCVMESRPTPPVEVTPSTIVFIKRLSDKEYLDVPLKLDRQFSHRVKQYRRSADEEVVELVGRIKSGAPIIWTEFSFDVDPDITNPGAIYKSVTAIFKGLPVFDEDEGYIGENFTAYAQYIVEGFSGHKALLELQVTSTHISGNVVLRLYALEEEEGEKILNRFATQIGSVCKALKYQPYTSLGNECSQCGGNIGLEAHTPAGFLECRYCHHLFLPDARLTIH